MNFSRSLLLFSISSGLILCAVDNFLISYLLSMHLLATQKSAFEGQSYCSLQTIRLLSSGLFSSAIHKPLTHSQVFVQIFGILSHLLLKQQLILSFQHASHYRLKSNLTPNMSNAQTGAWVGKPPILHASDLFNLHYTFSIELPEQKCSFGLIFLPLPF